MACIAQRLNTVEYQPVTASSIMGDGILSIVLHGTWDFAHVRRANKRGFTRPGATNC